ncbi:hypothetical protein ACH5RR_024978 [Cinchona calisaya]|uniref:Uncharacterized protein n=1 Tax=Cinchona calisaya TaxID=153742 RepID=A0ABD2Z0B7_9GENT
MNLVSWAKKEFARLRILQKQRKLLLPDQSSSATAKCLLFPPVSSSLIPLNSHLSLSLFCGGRHCLHTICERGALVFSTSLGEFELIPFFWMFHAASRSDSSC